ncbi:MAG: ATP-dependent Clp protease proteolytic subunit [Candidatus Doudnabacteria bacterium]|nr:ATP-dependent Clp protease proteolytic subunit [Candidatus Doudnabacteria bacterium]
MEIWYTISGAIDIDTAHQLIVWVNQQLYNGSPSKLKIFLSSTGGDMDSAVRIYFYLKALPIEVEMIGFGQVDSAANTIFVSTKNRKALKNTRFLLHEGTFTVGNSTASLAAHEENLRLLNTLHKQNVDILSLETGKPREEISNILSEAKILTTEEAVELGLVSEIIEKLPLIQK